MRRGEHRLDGRQARRGGRQAFARPQEAHLIHRPADALERGVGRVGQAHLLEAQREARAEAHDDAAGRHLVERRAGHGQHHGVAGVGVDRAERQAEPVAGARLAQSGRHRAAVADGVTLEVRVVDPQRIQAPLAGLHGPADHVRDLAPGGDPQADAPREPCHDPFLSIRSPAAAIFLRAAAAGGWFASRRALRPLLANG